MEPREYERTAAAEDHHWWFRELRSIWEGLLRSATGGEPTSGLALDAGCGTGGNLRSLERGRSAIGIDLSPLALGLARERVSSPLTRGSVLDLPFADETFELVLCADVIYHREVADDVDALRELRRVLSPGGLLLLNVPAFDSLRSAHDRAMHTARRYSRESLSERLHDAGLEPVRLIYWNSLLFIPAVLLRWLRRDRGIRSEIVNLPKPINGFLNAVSGLDASAALKGIFPAGLSVAAVARREG